ncbi:MAG: VOC family protein [Betaproteobacteria bacterium]|nr:VOC family protein [Betaproteobacteria bacterium]
MSVADSASVDTTTSPPACTLDHIVVAAPDLASGARCVEQRLGVVPQAGGEHARIGTHNLLLRLGETFYLEVIAINAAAPAPTRPRWFDLDRRPPDATPQLWTWVARCDDIGAALAASSEPLGPPQPMSRGNLNWLISIPEDGARPLDGAGPALIEWQVEPHPARRLADHALRLEKLELRHPDPARVSRFLRSLGLAGTLDVLHAETPGLRALISTPHGLREL